MKNLLESFRCQIHSSADFRSKKTPTNSFPEVLLGTSLKTMYTVVLLIPRLYSVSSSRGNKKKDRMDPSCLISIQLMSTIKSLSYCLHHHDVVGRKDEVRVFLVRANDHSPTMELSGRFQTLQVGTGNIDHPPMVHYLATDYMHLWLLFLIQKFHRF